jgi:hypothetical protein
MPSASDWNEVKTKPCRTNHPQQETERTTEKMNCWPAHTLVSGRKQDGELEKETNNTRENPTGAEYPARVDLARADRTTQERPIGISPTSGEESQTWSKRNQTNLGIVSCITERRDFVGIKNQI